MSNPSNLRSPRNIPWSELVPHDGPPALGGFGVVFSARWQRKRVAVKVPIAVVLAGTIGGDISGVLGKYRRIRALRLRAT